MIGDEEVVPLDTLLPLCFQSYETGQMTDVIVAVKLAACPTQAVCVEGLMPTVGH